MNANNSSAAAPHSPGFADLQIHMGFATEDSDSHPCEDPGCALLFSQPEGLQARSRGLSEQGTIPPVDREKRKCTPEVCQRDCGFATVHGIDVLLARSHSLRRRFGVASTDARGSSGLKSRTSCQTNTDTRILRILRPNKVYADCAFSYHHLWYASDSDEERSGEFSGW